MTSWGNYVNNHINLSHSQEFENRIQELQLALQKCINSENGLILTGGNGGSATTADHFAADLALLGKRTGVRARSLCLNSHLGFNTAISNDLDYEEAISENIKNFSQTPNLILLFSASGNSKNVINAASEGIRQGQEVWVITGFDGGDAIGLPGIKYIHFQTREGEYGLTENLHLMLCHYLVDLLIDNFGGIK